jgi:hypothetical protein
VGRLKQFASELEVFFLRIVKTVSESVGGAIEGLKTLFDFIFLSVEKVRQVIAGFSGPLSIITKRLAPEIDIGAVIQDTNRFLEKSSELRREEEAAIARLRELGASTLIDDQRLRIILRGQVDVANAMRKAFDAFNKGLPEGTLDKVLTGLQDALKRFGAGGLIAGLRERVADAASARELREAFDQLDEELVAKLRFQLRRSFPKLGDEAAEALLTAMVARFDRQRLALAQSPFATLFSVGDIEEFIDAAAGVFTGFGDKVGAEIDNASERIKTAQRDILKAQAEISKAELDRLKTARETADSFEKQAIALDTINQKLQQRSEEIRATFAGFGTTAGIPTQSATSVEEGLRKLSTMEFLLELSVKGLQAIERTQAKRATEAAEVDRAAQVEQERQNAILEALKLRSEDVVRELERNSKEVVRELRLLADVEEAIERRRQQRRTGEGILQLQQERFDRAIAEFIFSLKLSGRDIRIFPETIRKLAADFGVSSEDVIRKFEKFARRFDVGIVGIGIGRAVEREMDRAIGGFIKSLRAGDLELATRALEVFGNELSELNLTLPEALKALSTRLRDTGSSLLEFLRPILDSTAFAGFDTDVKKFRAVLRALGAASETIEGLVADEFPGEDLVGINTKIRDDVATIRALMEGADAPGGEKDPVDATGSEVKSEDPSTGESFGDIVDWLKKQWDTLRGIKKDTAEAAKEAKKAGARAERAPLSNAGAAKRLFQGLIGTGGLGLPVTAGPGFKTLPGTRGAGGILAQIASTGRRLAGVNFGLRPGGIPSPELGDVGTEDEELQKRIEAFKATSRQVAAINVASARGALSERERQEMKELELNLARFQNQLAGERGSITAAGFLNELSSFVEAVRLGVAPPGGQGDVGQKFFFLAQELVGLQRQVGDQATQVFGGLSDFAGGMRVQILDLNQNLIAVLNLLRVLQGSLGGMQNLNQRINAGIGGRPAAGPFPVN